DLRLHKLVFENKISQLSQLLNHDKEDEHFEQLKDQHGNTPLHLAVMLGHKECVQLLLKHGHGILIKNQYNWTPLQEAVSYGDRQTITSMYRFHRRQRKPIKKQKPEIREALKALGGDFYMEMRWDFQSWIPFVSRILPADICHIYRSGNKIRMDSTLEDFSEMRWVHGDITLIVDFSMDEPDVLLLDNKNKVYQHMKESTPQEHEASIEDEVDISMSTDIVDAAMKTKESSIEPVNTGWFFTHQKSEKIGQFTADFYRISNLLLVTRKRREHLSEEDLKKNKMLSEAISKGEDAGKILDDCDRDPERRQSLPPPEPCTVTWEDYSNTTSDPCLGRSRKEKLNTKKFEASLGMSTEFPVKLENLLPIFAALGTKAKLFLKLKEFVTLRLPSGFPVRITIPVFPTVKAVVNFPQFEFRTSIPSSMFSVPSDYREEPSWFEKS
uniref:Ankyrin repeat domain-containing protein n=1 Tax=Ciona savignyi TaxID=51511 RepID=H2YIA2_CIOSA